MNLAFHLVLNYFLGRFIGFTPADALVISFSGALIDIDHLFNVIFIQKHRSVWQVVDFAKTEGKLRRPHFYIFHTIEFQLALFLVSLYAGGIFILASIGFLLHLLEDSVSYVLHYRSLKPWLGYFSAAYLLMSKQPL